jgi:hypothetical protein
MSLPEFVTPVLSIAGPATLVLVVMRCFPHTAARAAVVMAAGIVAIVNQNDKRRAACHKVLDTLARRDSEPPPLP